MPKKTGGLAVPERAIYMKKLLKQSAKNIL